MNNNEGFTLIELIATIALLAVIATISFVSINAVIKNNKLENCKTVVNGIITATNEYVSDNRYKTEFVNTINDNKTTINASVLINNNYLNGDIIDPYTKEIIAPETISIEILFNEDYTMKTAVVNSPDRLKDCNAVL